MTDVINHFGSLLWVTPMVCSLKPIYRWLSVCRRSLLDSVIVPPTGIGARQDAELDRGPVVGGGDMSCDHNVPLGLPIPCRRVGACVVTGNDTPLVAPPTIRVTAGVGASVMPYRHRVPSAASVNLAPSA